MASIIGGGLVALVRSSAKGESKFRSFGPFFELSTAGGSRYLTQNAKGDTFNKGHFFTPPPPEGTSANQVNTKVTLLRKNLQRK